MGQAGSVAALNAEEKRLLKDSWGLVKMETKKNAIAILLSFFKKFPEQQKKFAAFADVPIDELSTNSKFIAHALSVVFAVSSIISQLDDDDVAQAIVAKQVHNHIPRGVTLENYKSLQGVIAEYLAPNLSDDDLKAWVHAFEIFNALVEINLK